MKTKKTFPISAVAAAVLFVVFYVLVDIPLGLSLVLAVCGFVGCSFLAKPKKRERDVLTGGISQKELDEALAAGYEKLVQIKKYNGFAYATPIRDDLNAIEMTTVKIFEEIKRDPPDLKRAQQFLSYYLDATLRILSKYAELRKHGVNNSEISDSLEHVEKVFSSLRTGFDTQFSRLLSNDVSDLDVELSLLESTLKMEGLCE